MAMKRFKSSVHVSQILQKIGTKVLLKVISYFRHNDIERDRNNGESMDKIEGLA